MEYVLAGSDEGQNITVFVPGRAPEVAHSSHPNFDAIVKGVLANDESVIDLFDVATSATSKFERLTERISTANGRLYFDNEEVDNALTGQVVRFLKDGETDWKPLVNFFENVQTNPNEHSREQLFTWLDARDFTITPDGLIVGYKSVYKQDDGTFKSVHGGIARVNGKVQEGRIVQKDGDVVEMPRGEVQHDPAIGCHTGLHVGTYDYAEGFSGDTILEVHVNPRDVVSVPTDSNAEKVRTCRYTVVGTIDKPYKSAVTYSDEFEGEGDLDWGDGEVNDFEGDLYYEAAEAALDDVAGIAEAAEAELLRLAGFRLDDEKPVTDLEDAPVDSTVKAGDLFETTDKRRAGTQFRVESIEGDEAIGKSLPNNLTRRVALDRLNSYRYRKVASSLPELYWKS